MRYINTKIRLHDGIEFLTLKISHLKNLLVDGEEDSRWTFQLRIGTFCVPIALRKTLRFQRHNLFPHIL